MILDALENEKDENCIMRAGQVRVVSNVTAETSILVLTALEPGNYLLCFFMSYWLLKSSETGERPISASHF